VITKQNLSEEQIKIVHTHITFLEEGARVRKLGRFDLLSTTINTVLNLLTVLAFSPDSRAEFWRLAGITFNWCKGQSKSVPAGRRKRVPPGMRRRGPRGGPLPDPFHYISAVS
jgi:hypothetical protein